LGTPEEPPWSLLHHCPPSHSTSKLLWFPLSETPAEEEK
jgi:hypothetical protein